MAVKSGRDDSWDPRGGGRPRRGRSSERSGPRRSWDTFGRVSQKYGIPLSDLPAHCLDAVDAAERTRARTLIVKGPLAVAAIVPMSDFDRVDPPDPGAAGVDPLLALCGACRHDDFVDTFVSDLNQTTLWNAGRTPVPDAPMPEARGPRTMKAGSPPRPNTKR